MSCYPRFRFLFSDSSRRLSTRPGFVFPRVLPVFTRLTYFWTRTLWHRTAGVERPQVTLPVLLSALSWSGLRNRHHLSIGLWPRCQNLLHVPLSPISWPISHEKYYMCSVTQSCPTFYGPIDSGPADSSVHGIFQAGIPEWVAISYSRGSSSPKGQTSLSCVSCIGRWTLYRWPHLGSLRNIIETEKD